MTERQARVLTVTLIVHLIVLRFTIRDLRRRPDAAVRGSKRFWRVAASLNTTGSVAYWLVGRRRTPELGAPSPASAAAGAAPPDVRPSEPARIRRTDRARRDRPRSRVPRRRAGSTGRGRGRPPHRAPCTQPRSRPTSRRRPGGRRHAVRVDPERPRRIGVGARDGRASSATRRARRWTGAGRSTSAARRHRRRRSLP